MTNFVTDTTSEKERGTYFGDMTDDVTNEEFVVLPDDEMRIENIVVNHLKKFPSISQARKNNWFGPVPLGFKSWKIGKTFFWTFRPF